MGMGAVGGTRLLSSSLSPQIPELLVGGDSVTQQWSQGLLCAKYYPGIGNLAVNRDKLLLSRVDSAGDRCQPTNRLPADCHQCHGGNACRGGALGREWGKLSRQPP